MKSTNIIITIIILVLIGGGIYVLNNNTGTESMIKDEMPGETMMMEKDATMSSTSETMMKKDDTMIMVKGGSYEAYSPEKLANAEKGNVVLFFRAGWCQTCRTVDADIKANIKNIPPNLTILDIDFDKSSDLKKKYGVTTQHTFVQLDSKGKFKKWIGGSTLDSVVDQVE